MLGLRTLVLNPNFTPETIIPHISTIPAEEAIVSVMSGDVNCVKYYDRQVLTPSRSDLQWPSVVVHKAFYKRYDDVRLSNAALFYRDHGYCQYCEKQLTISSVTRDHVTPRSKGGADSWENTVAACRSCNAKKDDNLPKGIWVPKKKPYAPSVMELFDKRKDFPITVPDAGWMDFLGNWRAPVKVTNRFIECAAEGE